MIYLFNTLRYYVDKNHTFILGNNILELSTAKNTHSALLSTANSNQKMVNYKL